MQRLRPRLVYFDTETTGMTRRRGESVCAGHAIVELAFFEPARAEHLDEGHADRVFHTYLNPCRPCDTRAREVHGLTDSFLAAQPVFAGALARQVAEQMRGCTLVAHNAPFDLAFLDQALLGAGLFPHTHYCAGVIDTLALARAAFPRERRNSLDALCERFALPARESAIHGALEDCRLLHLVHRKIKAAGQRELELN